MVLPQFVENSLLQRILQLVAKGEFVELEHKERSDNVPDTVIARELALSVHSPLLRLFHLLLNSPLLLTVIQQLVDRGADRFPKRRDVGGVEIREGLSTARRAVAGFGDAVLFRVALGLEHRGLPSTGTVSRCAFSGWFVATSDPRKALGMARRNRLGAALQ